MTEQEKAQLAEKIGNETASKLKTAVDGVTEKAKEIAEAAVKTGGITKASFDEYQTKADEALEEAKTILAKQGMTINELSEKLSTSSAGRKSIAETLADNEEAIKEVAQKGNGNVQFMITTDAEGRPVAKRFDPMAKKAADTHTTTTGIAQNLSGAAILRLAGDVPILSAYRNTPFLFALVNLVNATFENGRMAIWMEETAKQGGSAVVPEGGQKPLVQYAYELKSAQYRKQAQMLSFTDEFAMDFERTQSDILGRGLVDLINDINSDIMPRVIAAATAYNTGAQFTGGEPIPNANDFDAIVAMAAQVKNSTFGAMPNGALMSTFKEGRMAITKDAQGAYIGRPQYLDPVAFIGNPTMGNDNVVVGDFTNYNVILRGGVIVKVGYNGNDFAENKFSVVQEQFYFDYISEIRKKALVKGPTFADVKQAIGS
jgi:hypothetical protein